MGGASIMTLELLGSRVLAPYVGTTLGVWTSLIGVILGSLSLGYYLGGRWSDRHPHLSALAWILFGSGVAIALVSAGSPLVLRGLSRRVPDVRVGSLVAATVLFAVPSTLLAMIAPYAVRLRLQDTRRSGRTVGRLYAISTVGSIAGTFLAGFWLIPYFGNGTLLLLLGLGLILLSLGTSFRAGFTLRATAAVAVAGYGSGLLLHSTAPGRAASLDFDTRYSRVQIYDARVENRPIRVMAISREISSVLWLDDDRAPFGYIAFFDLGRHFVPELRRVLMLGGAGYTYPRHLLSVEPGARVDVVEIDPEVTELARRYFRLVDDPRLSIHHEDARVFLNRSGETFDAVLFDVYVALDTPAPHLTTREAVARVFERLSEGGAALVNITSAVKGPASRIFRAQYGTWADVFPHVLVFRVNPRTPPEERQNLMLLALKAKETPSLSSQDPDLAQYLSQRWTEPVPRDLPILTDDHAPIELYVPSRRS